MSKRKEEDRSKARQLDNFPILLVGESIESSRAIVELTRARLPFSPVPGEGSDPVLFSSRRTFCGIKGIRRYIKGKRAGETSEERQ